MKMYLKNFIKFVRIKKGGCMKMLNLKHIKENNSLRFLKRGFTIGELTVTLIVITIVVIVSLPITYNKMKKAVGDQYYMGYEIAKDVWVNLHLGLLEGEAGSGSGSGSDVKIPGTGSDLNDDQEGSDVKIPGTGSDLNDNQEESGVDDNQFGSDVNDNKQVSSDLNDSKNTSDVKIP